MFGGIKFRDVIAGAAKAVDEQLKDDIERTKNIADDTAQYHIKRRQERSEQLEVDKQEVEDILEQFASFVDESNFAKVLINMITHHNIMRLHVVTKK